MTLIKSISGIRGTIGGKSGEGLSPLDIVKFTAAFGRFCMEKTGNTKMVVGRDARISGEMVRNIVVGTLQSIGMDVIDLGLSTTPTVEIAVPKEAAGGGIILTASHNPAEWNALKLLNEKGEFINADEGEQVLEIAERMDFNFSEVYQLGSLKLDNTYIQKHIDEVLRLPLVDIEAIKKANLSVVLDAVNSTGGLFVPPLLEALGVQQVHQIHCEPDGHFPHNPEPLAKHLEDLSQTVVAKKADLGIAVDPDVDRLVFVMEDGVLFGEEYTLVAVADYILEHHPGNTVSNLSSTRALRDVTEKHGGVYHAAAVGEVNVVEKMKEVSAVIGGEGNGGVIYPETHYGRDALAGIALFLTHLAKKALSMTALKRSYPQYYMSKNKITLTPEMDIDAILKTVQEKYKTLPHSTIDGLKIDFEDEWIHLRKSNTEPIIRVYSEAGSPERAETIAKQMVEDVQALIV